MTDKETIINWILKNRGCFTAFECSDQNKISFGMVEFVLINLLNEGFLKNVGSIVDPLYEVKK